jgi:hypothetical protein
MANAVHEELVTEVARKLVAQIAPEEAPMFPATSQMYLRRQHTNHGQPRQDEGDQDDMLGFGLAIPVALLAPVVLDVVSRVVTFLAGQVGKGLEDQSGPIIQDALKAVFRRFLPAESQVATASPLTREQLKEVREVAMEEALRHHLAQEQADQLVDSLVAELAVND